MTFTTRKMQVVDTLLGTFQRIREYPYDRDKDREFLEKKLPSYPNDIFTEKLIAYLTEWMKCPELMGDKPRERLEQWLDHELSKGLGKKK